jgi:hypothetical protein
MSTTTPERLCDHAEKIFKLRNALWLEINKAVGPVCDDESANKAMELLVDQLAQWQRMDRKLQIHRKKINNEIHQTIK